MPVYHYKARHRESGKLITHRIEAANREQAIKKLRAKGLLILSVSTDKSLDLNFSFGRSIGSRDRILFARQFAVMMRAGLPIIQALQAIEDQTASKRFRKILTSLRKEVEGGTSLSESFSHHPEAFPPIFVSVARIGEKSGKLEDVLERLATQLEGDDELRSKVKGALIYPAFVLFALLAVMVLIMVYIIPQLKGLFEDVAAELPAITKGLLALSGFLQRTIVGWLIGLAILLISTKLAALYSPAVRYRFEQLRLHLPIFGRLYRLTLMARFNHTLATLLSAGLPMLEALRTTADVMDSPTYTQSLQTISRQIESGQTLSQSLLTDKQFPPMVGHMVAIGERSGSIDSVLETVAGFYDKEVNGMTRNLSALLEPILMLIMGVGVALVVASVIVPIYNLVNAV